METKVFQLNLTEEESKLLIGIYLQGMMRYVEKETEGVMPVDLLDLYSNKLMVQNVSASPTLDLKIKQLANSAKKDANIPNAPII